MNTNWVPGTDETGRGETTDGELGRVCRAMTHRKKQENLPPERNSIQRKFERFQSWVEDVEGEGVPVKTRGKNHETTATNIKRAFKSPAGPIIFWGGRMKKKNANFLGKKRGLSLND